MKLSTQQAVSIFSNLGYQGVESWTQARLEKRVLSLDTAINGEPETGDEDVDALINDVLTALRESEEVTVGDDDNEEEEKPTKKKKTQKAVAEESSDDNDINDDEGEKPEKKRVPKKPAKADKPAKQAKEKTEATDKEKKPRREVPRDVFGTRVGSGSALINAALSDSPQSFEDLAKASGQNLVRVKDHVRWMIKNGFAEKVEDGVQLTGNTK